MRNKAMAEEEKPKTAENGTIAAAVTDEEAAESETEAETTGDKAYGAGSRNGTAGGEPSRCGFVALLGAPNAGKSTLLSVVSAAKPKIADYAFTTLEPNLGIVEVRDHKSFVMADIPGIIEGAHEGRGLGTRFLRHIERNSVLLFLIPADSDDIRRDYDVLLGELTQYNPELLDKERLLAVTKCDMLDEDLIAEIRGHLPEGVPSVFISSVSGLNIPRLKDMLWEALQR